MRESSDSEVRLGNTNGCKRTMADYDEIVSQMEERNAIRQREWREKALARRSRGKKKTPYDDGGRFGEDSDEERQVDELPAHRRRRRRNQHLIPGKCLFVAHVGRGRHTNSRYGKRFSSERRACRACRLWFLVPAGLPLSLPLP